MNAGVSDAAGNNICTSSKVIIADETGVCGQDGEESEQRNRTKKRKRNVDGTIDA